MVNPIEISKLPYFYEISEWLVMVDQPQMGLIKLILFKLSMAGLVLVPKLSIHACHSCPSVLQPYQPMSYYGNFWSC